MYKIYNNKVNYSEDLGSDYDAFIEQMFNNHLKQVDAKIIWNNNPDATLATSTQDKNTPILSVMFGSVSSLDYLNGYRLLLKANTPSDYYNLFLK